MQPIIKNVQSKFTATILLVVVFIVALSWGILQYYNQREIAAPAHSAEVHQSAENNIEFANYLQEQKEYEAHFVTLATDIKEQEAARVTRALAVTSVIAVLVGILVAIIAAKRLMKPVVEAYESQERFMQDAAHELRNPLAAMTAALQQTKEKSPTITAIQRQTKRLININEDLLYLERRHKQEPEQLNLTDLLYDIVEELQPIARKHTIKLSVDSDKDIMKRMASGDYVRLLRNVVSNAIKYSHDTSEVIISQKVTKNTIDITVEDSGIGIPKKDLDKIGERFFRASNTGTISGTGLGLAIARKILNTYNGTISVDSTVNKGTKVTLSLPS